ncbi:heavy metal translocating P-type ATPase [Cohnella sp. CIP 111063]|uniref:heavy metal translocating P-type ATPase n=1 Tax=unclassified Cohnella TaxID=2636738 RepID=UPI000B8BFBA7|nr:MULTISPECIES: heavy metal translocating P-type ATPase [unclassified Cohnella]OXS59991.1 heavy metal translocating P-type ATPase [Cohnella sp. CIP 111063]PRX72807.1 Cd2+/Zn2+-exporting ATPase [Cohnella sp. SGD-V74]
MIEYRVKGLSCGNCARTLEEEIQRLDHGESATLSFASGKLKLDERVQLDRVRQILKSDRAYLVEAAADAAQSASGMAGENSGAHSHGHSREQEHGHRRSHGHEHSHGHEAGDAHEHNRANAHEHDHAHAHGNKRMIVQLAVSAAIYVAALVMDGRVPFSVAVSFYLIAAALSGYATFVKGARNLLRLKFNIDTLMTVALVGAVSIGEWKEATLVAILFGVNELLEGLGMEKARRSMERLLSVAPKQATKLDDGVETIVPIAALRAGDTVVVKPGEKIPSDGAVVFGRSSVNEAAITGESLPLEKAEGDPVFGGSINNEGVIRVRIGKAYKDSSLARILHLVEEAQETKTPTELFIDRFAKYYTPLIMIVAALVVLVPPLLLDGDWTKCLYQGLAVLIVGCPCALILSSPIAILSGIARSARNGILVKGGVHLEQLGKLDTLAFDKTGTLTKGEPHVERMTAYDQKRFLSVAGAIEKTSSHPLAKAIMKEVERAGAAIPEAIDTRAVPGRGAVAECEGETYWLGNENIVEHFDIPAPVREEIDSYKQDGLTIVLVADRASVLGLFGIADEIREESASVLSALRRQGIRRAVMLTGDHAKTAEKVAKAVGVDEAYGNLLPEEKVAKVKRLSEEGIVGMIGDGINDAPALASASLGIAMGKGTDSAIETADVVLMQDHLGKLPEAIRTAKRVNRTIRFNIAVSLGLKLAALLLTLPGWLTLWFAILSDMGATVFVTLVSLTILIERKR